MATSARHLQTKRVSDEHKNPVRLSDVSNPKPVVLTAIGARCLRWRSPFQAFGGGSSEGRNPTQSCYVQKTFAGGVDALHSRGIIHTDIKLENAMLSCREGECPRD